MRKIKMGVLGVSGHLLGRMILPMTQSEDIEVVALASRNLEKKAEAAAKEWSIEKAFGSYEALLEDSDIEAVYIPLPNHLHVEWIKKSVDAGKHVICEKPITLTEDEVVALQAYIKDKPVKVMEAFMYRFHPKWQKVKEIMKVKEIGQVKAIHTIFTYSNTDPNNIRNIKAFGGGGLMDIGCYAISSSRWILGREPDRVMGLNTYSDVFGTDVLSSGILDFGEVRTMFTVSTALFPAQEVKVYGTSGTLSVKLPFNDPHDIPAEVTITTGLGEKTLTFEPTNQYGSMFTAFAKAIREDLDVPVSLNDSYFNMRIINRLLESGDTGEWLSI